MHNLASLLKTEELSWCPFWLLEIHYRLVIPHLKEKKLLPGRIAVY